MYLGRSRHTVGAVTFTSVRGGGMGEIARPTQPALESPPEGRETPPQRVDALPAGVREALRKGRADSASRENREHLAAVLEQLPDPVLIAGLDHRLTLVNAA